MSGTLDREKVTARQSRSLITLLVLSLICSRRGKVPVTLFPPRVIKAALRKLSLRVLTRQPATLLSLVFKPEKNASLSLLR